MNQEKELEKIARQLGNQKKKISILKDIGLLDDILNWTPEECSISEKIYCFLFKIKKSSMVCECGKPLDFINWKTGYRSFCSISCSSKSKETLKKKANTCLSKYGVEHQAKSKDVRKKTKETCLKKYGVDCSLNSESSIKKSKETSLKHFGTDHHLKSIDNRRKYKEKIKILYGDEEITRTDYFRNKFKETCQEKYGSDHFMQSLINNDIKQKIKNTNIEKYGATHLFGSKEYIEERQRNHRDRYFENLKRRLEDKNLSITSSKKDYVDNSHVRIKCDICLNEFEPEVCYARTIYCDKCFKELASKEERNIKEWLDSIQIKNEKTRSIISPYELDIYIPEHKLAIEFDGLYWHSEIKKDKDYHLMKYNLCKGKEIQLIHVFENEWINLQKIVKSIILSKLGIYQDRIYARKCVIKELNQQDYNEFLDTNHLQGKSIAKTRLGLYYNDKLVSVMGLGKSRFKKDETELIRFANLLNTQIIGGFSKLLKYFTKNYQFYKLVSYVDLRYFDGSGYLKNGFEIVSQSKPNYFYFKKGSLNIESRMQFQKHKLKDKLEIYDENLSEHENMLNNEYYRIYDCGNLRLEYKR